MITRFRLPLIQLDLATSVLCAAMPVLYPICARYARKGARSNEHGLADFACLWVEARETVQRTIVALGYLHDSKVICDATNNTPDLIEQGTLGISVFAKLHRSADAFGGNYALRWVESGVIEVAFQ